MMKRLILLILLLPCIAYGFPEQTNTASVTVGASSGEDYDQWLFKVEGWSDQRMIFTMDKDYSSYNFGFKIAKQVGTGQVSYISYNSQVDTNRIGITSTVVTVTIPHTNIPPDATYKNELLMWDANTNRTRVAGRGTIKITESLYDDDDGTFPWPGSATLTDYLSINQAATQYINRTTFNISESTSNAWSNATQTLVLNTNYAAATGGTNTVTRDGTQGMLANLDLGGNNITNISGITFDGSSKPTTTNSQSIYIRAGASYDVASITDVAFQSYSGSITFAASSLFDFTGASMDLSGETLYGVKDPTAGTHVGDRDYNDARYLLLDGSSTMAGDLDMGSNGILNVDYFEYETGPNNKIILTDTISGQIPILRFIDGFAVTTGEIWYANSQFNIRKELVMLGNIIPSTSNTYDLGSTTRPWQDLYVGTSSIHFIGVSGNGDLDYDASAGRLTLGGTNVLITGDAATPTDVTNLETTQTWMKSSLSTVSNLADNLTTTQTWLTSSLGTVSNEVNTHEASNTIHFAYSNWLDATAASALYLDESSNLSDLNSAATARTNLSLVVGTDVQAYDVNLDSLSSPSSWVMFISDGSEEIQEVSWTASGYLKSTNSSVAPFFGDLSTDVQAICNPLYLVAAYSNSAAFTTDVQAAQSTPTLDEIGNPGGDVSFGMANKQLAFEWTANTTDGIAMEIELKGATTNDGLHIHQHTGNTPGMDLLHLEADDADARGLRIDMGAGTSAALIVDEGYVDLTGDYITNAVLDGSDVTVGTVADARIASTIARDTGDTYTGAHDFGGATSIEIVNAADPTVDAVGEIAYDTTDNTLQIYDGTAERVIAHDIFQYNFTVYELTDWNSQAVPIAVAPKDMAITIVQVHAAIMGGTSLNYNIEERAKGSLNSAGTDVYTTDQIADQNGEDETSFANAGIAAGAYLVLTTAAAGAETGTVAAITGSIYYRKDVE